MYGAVAPPPGAPIGWDSSVTLALVDGDLTDTMVDVSRVADTRHVVHLNLWNNDIVAIAGLERFPNLQRLTLASNDLQDVRGLNKQAPNLRWLDVSNNDCRDFSGADSLVNLEWVDATNNDITSLEGLSNLPSLVWLNLRTNDLADLSTMRPLYNLRVLDLSNNDLKTIRGIFQCAPSLGELNLADNDLEVTDEVTALTQLRHLFHLNIFNNDFPNDGEGIVAAFRSFPHVRVNNSNRHFGDDGGSGPVAPSGSSEACMIM